MRRGLMEGLDMSTMLETAIAELMKRDQARVLALAARNTAAGAA